MIKLHEYNYKPRNQGVLLSKQEKEQGIAKDNKLIGIEVEMELTRRDTPLFKETFESLRLDEEFNAELAEYNTRNAEHAVYGIQALAGPLKTTRFYAKRDGSLTDGCELVSPPFSLQWMEENSKSLKALFRKAIQVGFNSYDTGSCGMHIHLSKTHFKGVMHLLRFYTFFQQNATFFHNLSRRSPVSTGTYAFFMKDPLSHYLRNFASGTGRLDHHEAIELRHTNTVEVRIFRGTLNLESIKSYIYMMERLVDYTATVFYRQMSLDGFVRYVQTLKKSHINKGILKILEKGKKIPELPNPDAIKKWGTPDGDKTVFTITDHIQKPNSRWGKSSPSRLLPLADKGYPAGTDIVHKFWGWGWPANGIKVVGHAGNQPQTAIPIGIESLSITLASLNRLELPRECMMNALRGLRSVGMRMGYFPDDSNTTMFYPESLIQFENGQAWSVNSLSVAGSSAANTIRIVECFYVDWVGFPTEPLHITRTLHQVGGQAFFVLKIVGIPNGALREREGEGLFNFDINTLRRDMIPGLGFKDRSLEEQQNLMHLWNSCPRVHLNLDYENTARKKPPYSLPMNLRYADEATRLTWVSGMRRLENAVTINNELREIKGMRWAFKDGLRPIVPEHPGPFILEEMDDLHRAGGR